MHRDALNIFIYFGSENENFHDQSVNDRNCNYLKMNSGKTHIEERRLVFRSNALGDFNVRKGTTVRGAARSSHSRKCNVFLPRG